MNEPKRPNLFIIGAMKSGTTSLHTYLQMHPQIFMSEPKEPFYFIRELNWKRGESWYLSLFATANHHAVIGESTTAYTKRPLYEGVPERIRAFNPDARFVYIMRDPVERTISHYWHHVRWQSEHREILNAIRYDPHYSDVSNYAMQLEPFVKLFGRDKVFTLTFEELTSNPNRVLTNLYSWLGISKDVVLPGNDLKKNVTPHQVEQARAFGLVNRFRYSSLWERIHKFFPPQVKRLGKPFALRKVNREKIPMGPTIQYLRPIQLKQTEVLKKMLSRDFPEWTTLNNVHPEIGKFGRDQGALKI